MKLSGWKFRRDIPSPGARERWIFPRRFVRLSRQRFDDLQGLIELGFIGVHHVGMQDILGRDGEDNGLKGFGSRFEAEGFVDRGESLVKYSTVMSRSMRAVLLFCLCAIHFAAVVWWWVGKEVAPSKACLTRVGLAVE